MPNRKKDYTDLKKFAETRKKQKKRYYAKTAIYKQKRWTSVEDNMVLEHNITDTELSQIIHHSVAAIQHRRYRLKHRKIKRG